eukprot:scaffold275661_cov34-Prasinocladus_malaysianus.AAC.2
MHACVCFHPLPVRGCHGGGSPHAAHRHQERAGPHCMHGGSAVELPGAGRQCFAGNAHGGACGQARGPGAKQDPAH